MRSAIGIWLVVEAVILLYAFGHPELNASESTKCFLGLTIIFTMIHAGLWLIFG